MAFCWKRTGFSIAFKESEKSSGLFVILQSLSCPNSLGTASGGIPAPGAGGRSALRFARHLHSERHAPFGFRHPPTNFNRSQDQLAEIASVPPKKHALGWGAAATRLLVPKRTGPKKEIHTMTHNRLTLIGFLGQDAKKRFTPNGTPVTTFSVATKTSWKDQQGEWQSHTEWHRAICLGGEVRRIRRHAEERSPCPGRRPAPEPRIRKGRRQAPGLRMQSRIHSEAGSRRAPRDNHYSGRRTR